MAEAGSGQQYGARNRAGTQGLGRLGSIPEDCPLRSLLSRKEAGQKWFTRWGGATSRWITAVRTRKERGEVVRKSACCKYTGSTAGLIPPVLLPHADLPATFPSLLGSSSDPPARDTLVALPRLARQFCAEGLLIEDFGLLKP